jgi:hypothetical protein
MRIASLRWHDPDQVRRSKRKKLPLSPVHRTPVFTASLSRAATAPPPHTLLTVRHIAVMCETETACSSCRRVGHMPTGHTPANTPAQIIIFIVAVVAGTTVVILLTQWVTNSWAIAATAGVVAAVLSTVMYPIVFRKR